MQKCAGRVDNDGALASGIGHDAQLVVQRFRGVDALDGRGGARGNVGRANAGVKVQGAQVLAILVFLTVAEHGQVRVGCRVRRRRLVEAHAIAMAGDEYNTFDRHDCEQANGTPGTIDGTTGDLMVRVEAERIRIGHWAQYIRLWGAWGADALRRTDSQNFAAAAAAAAGAAAARQTPARKR